MMASGPSSARAAPISPSVPPRCTPAAPTRWASAGSSLMINGTPAGAQCLQRGGLLQVQRGRGGLVAVLQPGRAAASSGATRQQAGGVGLVGGDQVEARRVGARGRLKQNSSVATGSTTGVGQWRSPVFVQP